MMLSQCHHSYDLCHSVVLVRGIVPADILGMCSLKNQHWYLFTFARLIDLFYFKKYPLCSYVLNLK